MNPMMIKKRLFWLMLLSLWGLMTGLIYELTAIIVPLAVIWQLHADWPHGSLEKRSTWLFIHAFCAALLLMLIGARFKVIIFEEMVLSTAWAYMLGAAQAAAVFCFILMTRNVGRMAEHLELRVLLEQAILEDEALARSKAQDGALVGRVREQLARHNYDEALSWARAITHPDLQRSMLELIERTEERRSKEKKS